MASSASRRCGSVTWSTIRPISVIPALLAILGGIYLLIMPLWWIPFGATWHDQQRWFQLLLLTGAFIYAAWRPWAWQPLLRRPGAFVILVVALGAGLLASAFAAKPGWAVMEVALTLGLIQWALLIAWAYVVAPEIFITS